MAGGNPNNQPRPNRRTGNRDHPVGAYIGITHDNSVALLMGTGDKLYRERQALQNSHNFVATIKGAHPKKLIELAEEYGRRHQQNALAPRVTTIMVERLGITPAQLTTLHDWAGSFEQTKDHYTFPVPRPAVEPSVTVASHLAAEGAT